MDAVASVAAAGEEEIGTIVDVAVVLSPTNETLSGRGVDPHVRDGIRNLPVMTG